MSAEDVDILRRGWESFGRRGLDGAIALYSEAVVIEDPPDLPGAATHLGHAGLKAALDRFTEVWEDWDLTPVEFIDGGEEVVVVCELRAQGEGGGVPVVHEAVFVYRLRDRRIIHERRFFSRRQAMEALGLSG